MKDTTPTSIEEIRRKVLPILRPYRVTRAGLFGSAARGDMREHSDVDMLVQIEEDISLLEFVELKLKLEDALGRKVDLVECDTLKPALRQTVLKEQVVIL